MYRELKKKQIRVLNQSYTLDLPSNIKNSEILNEKLLKHILENYKDWVGTVILQGDNFGLYSIFFEKELKKNVIVLEPNKLIIPISQNNLSLNNCQNTIYINEILSVSTKKYDIHTNPITPLSYDLVESNDGEIHSYITAKINNNIGCIIINNSGGIDNIDSIISELDANNNQRQLIIVKKSCLKTYNKYNNYNIVDDYAGYVFYSKEARNVSKKNEDKVKKNNNHKNDVGMSNELNKLVSHIQSLTAEVAAIQQGRTIQFNVVNVINELRPNLERNDLVRIEKSISSIINAYEKEIYNLNKTINKRNNKIKALLESHTWKYTQFMRNKLGFSELTFQEYLDRNEHIDSLDKNLIDQLRSDILQITNQQNEINNTIVNVIKKNPKRDCIESSTQFALDEIKKVAPANFTEINTIGNNLLSDMPIVSGKRFSNNSQLNSSKHQKMAGLAAIPSREKALRRVVNSLIPQVDKVGVYLNGWKDIPSFLNHPKILIAKSQDFGDLGDAGKFFWINDFEGYYFSCDDDLVYPHDYVERTINKIKEYNYKAVVGWHGSVVSDSFKDYYDPKDRRVFSYSAGRPFDLDVHILGTGVLGFHTDTIKVCLEDFERPNMADIFFARLGQQQNVRFIVMEHKPKEIETIEEFQEDSINKHGQKQVQSVKNVREYKNSISTALNWHLNNAQSLNILLIGRFDTFKKGGIHKSNLLIEKYLKDLDHNVYTIDSQSDHLEVLDHKIDIAMVYPGDPNRPDYPEAINKMEVLRTRGVPILLNMSYNSNPQRSKFITETILNYNKEIGKSKVCLMAFSESIKFDINLYPIMKYIVSFPKTINIKDIDFSTPDFHNREGIFFGDATKLNNPEITNGKIINWVSEVRKRMPKTNFYVIKQYSGKFDIPNFEFVPYMNSNELMQWIGNRRLSICLNQLTTYEMVPVESQCVGTPVIYRSMLQSLNEAIGLTGIPVTEPNIFGEMCQWIYNDEVAWKEYSRLSLLNFKKNHIDACRIGLETAMRKVIAINIQE